MITTPRPTRQAVPAPTREVVRRQRWRWPPSRWSTCVCPGTATRSSWPSSSRSRVAYPDDGDEHGQPTELHLVMDNYATHKRGEVRDWLAKNPRILVHFTPTSASWMNLVEVWFGIIERQAIHRGTFGSVRDLNTKIGAFITGWNDRCPPEPKPSPTTPRRSPDDLALQALTA